MDYQLLALDLDGTLTNSKKEVSEPTIKALIPNTGTGKKSSSCQRTTDQRCCSSCREASS